MNLLMPPGADCHYLDVALLLVDANLTLPFCALNKNLFLIRSSKSPQTAPIVREKGKKKKDEEKKKEKEKEKKERIEYS